MVLAMAPEEQQEEVAAASPAPEPLSQAQVGRIIETLRADMMSKAVWEKRKHEYRGGRHYNYSKRMYETHYETTHQVHGPKVRRYTDEQIMLLLNLTTEQFRAARVAHRKTQRRPYTQRRVYAEFCKWVAKNKKWPSIDDFAPMKGTGLCSTWTLDQYVGRNGDIHRYNPKAQAGRLAELDPRPAAANSSLQWLIHYYCIDKYDRLTPQLILSVPNVTVRRDLMVKYGIENLLRDGGGVKMQEDEFGVLWRLPPDNFQDTATVYVEVVNSSPQRNEETGELILDDNGEKIFDHYFLRVAPTCFTAKMAVAWTFQEQTHNFNVIAQS